MIRRFVPALLGLAALVYGAIPSTAQSLIHLSPGGDLNGAMRRVSPNGAIELSAGLYPAPPGGFRITNPGKAFTVRAAVNANVVVDGAGSRPLLVFRNGSLGRGGLVTFRRIIFRNGLSTTEGTSGGVTLSAAQANFVRCTFSGNAANPATTGGGAVKVLAGSTANFTDCTFQGNHSKNRGGAMTVRNSTVTLLRGRFVNNRVDLPQHEPQAAGGAIYVLDGSLNVADSHFAGNRAGFAGGAIYAFGNYGVGAPGSNVVVTGSTFLDNHASPDPCCSIAAPAAGGAVHVEDRTALRVVRSRFEGNQANFGGAVDVFRANVEIDGSLFTANQATAGQGSVGAGGAIAVLSSDPAGEAGNRRPASLILRDSLFQGLPGPQPSAQVGGCLYVAGDDSRQYGDGGVALAGTVDDNRAPVTLAGDVFSSCAVAAGGGGAGTGGAIQADLVALTMTDCQVLGSQAQGDGARGGGMALVRESSATIARTTFAGNSAGAGAANGANTFGGGLFVNGSTVQIADGAFLANELSPGLAERINQSHGAALYTTPLPNPARAVSGAVSNTAFSGNLGLPIWDFQQSGGAANLVRYGGNPISSQSFGSLVYVNSLSAPSGTDVFGLNAIKGDAPNRQVFGPVSFGVLRAVPPTASVGAPASPAPSFLAFAWSGNSAVFAGQPLTLKWGLAPTAVGTFSLAVDGTTVATATVAP